MNMWLAIIMSGLCMSYISVSHYYHSYMHNIIVLFEKDQQYFYLTEGLLSYAVACLKNDKDNTIKQKHVTLNISFLNHIYTGKVTYNIIDKETLKLNAILLRKEDILYTLSYVLKDMRENCYKIISLEHNKL